MGNYIDNSVSVTGNADQLEQFWDALLADDHGGPLKLLKRETAFYQWRLAEKGGHSTLDVYVPSKSDPPYEPILEASRSFSDLTFVCHWLDCTGARTGLFIARGGSPLVDDVWQDAPLSDRQCVKTTTGWREIARDTSATINDVPEPPTQTTPPTSSEGEEEGEKPVRLFG